jgi:hypothetical protein
MISMKKIMLTTFSIVLVLLAVAQQDSTKKLNSLFGKAKGVINSVKGGKGSPLSTEEIVSGLKEALSVGTNNSTGKLSATDGFFKDAAVKLLMPEEAKKVEKTLRSIGAGKLVDDAILSLNRAAEDASKSAAPIFLNAIKKMTIQDAVGILKGTDTAATSYLRGATTIDLTTAFKPIIDASLEKVGATKYWAAVFNQYNKLPTTFKKVDTDISGYATGKALNGIFYYVASEEKKIRTNPVARVSDVLKKVFGTK